MSIVQFYWFGSNTGGIFSIISCPFDGYHKTIRPATPWHNGKVEHSHRNDQERFYNHLKFYSYEDLQLQIKRYLYRSNRIPMAVLDWMSPRQKRLDLESAKPIP